MQSLFGSVRAAAVTLCDISQRERHLLQSDVPARQRGPTSKLTSIIKTVFHYFPSGRQLDVAATRLLEDTEVSWFLLRLQNSDSAYIIRRQFGPGLSDSLLHFRHWILLTSDLTLVCLFWLG